MITFLILILLHTVNKIGMYGWLAIYTDLLTLSFISPCFYLIKETNECYFLRFTQHKVSSNVNDKVFSDFIKKEKTLFPGGSVFGRLTKYNSALAINPNLGSEVCIRLRGNFSLCGNSVFILLISSKSLETF